MAEILFLTYNSADTCSFYRSAGVAKDLRKKTRHNITVAQWSDIGLNWSMLAQYDLIMFQRAFTRDAAALCKYVKQIGVPLWIDWDDALFSLNRENKAFHLYQNPATQNAMKEIISLADVVTVTTEYLKQTLTEFNKNIHVIPNAYNDSFFERPADMPQRTNHVVWRGTDSHIRDLMMYSEVIANCYKNFPDWRYVFMGYDPWFLDEMNLIYNEMQDIAVYMKSLFNYAPAVVHVPLSDNTFNRCKSNVTAIEASYAGAVAICPAWWNMPGTITYEDTQSYYEALRTVLSGEVDKVVMNRMAWEYIMDSLALSKVNVMRLEVINSLI